MYLIRERLFRLGEDSDITDEQGQLVLHADRKVLSLHDRPVIRFTIDVPGPDDPLVLASVLALDPAEDREREQR